MILGLKRRAGHDKQMQPTTDMLVAHFRNLFKYKNVESYPFRKYTVDFLQSVDRNVTM